MGCCFRVVLEERDACRTVAGLVYLDQPRREKAIQTTRERESKKKGMDEVGKVRERGKGEVV